MIDTDALKRDKRPQSAWVVHALISRLEAAEKELAELRSSMKFRTSLIGRTEAERDALYAKVETAENDAAHQKALADSALRVAEGWERKCGELRAALRHEADCVEAAIAEIKSLRARIEEMERQEPVFWWRQCSDETYEGPIHTNSIERVRKQSGAWSPLYALPGAKGE